MTRKMAKALERFRSDEHSTLSVLIKGFNYEKVVRLEEVCDKYFGLNYCSAKKKASKHALPIPTFKLGDSQKSPYLVNLEDLASYIDSVTAKANQKWHQYQ